MINSSSTLSTFLGYHGNAPDRRAFIDEFAEDSDEDAIGLNWLTEAYQEDGDEDTCPVAVAFGDNRDDRHHMLDWGGFMDRENTGTRTSGATYYYIEGCNPDSGYEL